MIDFSKQFETDLILLRPVEQDDLEGFYECTKDSNLWIWFTADLSDKNNLQVWIETAIRDIKSRKRLALTIIDKTNRRIIGSTSLGNISWPDKRIEIGWTWMGREYQGKGINGQTKHLLLRYCFEERNFERVEFKTDVLNVPARKALIRIGATEEGILRSHTLMTHNRRRDTIYYSILKPEWENIKIKNHWNSAPV